MQHSSETGIPAFLTKLWTLLEDPSTEELICWDPSGRSFHIYEQARFAKEVLPHYFKHSNIASFIRQLNMYGFRKVVNIEHGGLKVERDDMEFAHQHFIKGKGHLLEYIKRKVTNVKTPTDDVKLKSDDVHKVLSDVRGIKGKQEVMNDKLDSLKHENETLWREVATLRQKHMKQQQIVNKLIQFLVTMVGNRPVLTRKRPLMLNDASQLLQSSPPKAPKLDRTLSIEASDESSSYSVQSPPDSSRTTTHPHTLTIQEVTDNLESPTLGFPQVPAYETVAGLPTTGTPAQPEDINIMDTDHDMTAVNPLVVLENTTISAPAAQPEIVSLPTDSTGQQVFTLGGQQILTIPANASSNTGAGTGAVPVQVIVLPANTATAAGDNGSMTSTTTSGSANTGNDSGLVYVPNTASIANNNSNAVAVSTANLTSATDGRAQAEKTKTPPEPVVCCNPSTSSLKDDNSKALCCNKTDVVQHIEGLDMELDGLKDIMTGNYNFDTTLLSGHLKLIRLLQLFNPEAPLPPTPEAYWNLEDKDSIVGNELMAYNPQSEDLSKLFDLDVPEESELEEVSDFDFDKHGSGLETPVFNPSTPMPSLSLASALASRRKSNQKTTTSTDEID